MDVYERLEDMDADTAEVRAAEILYGLGFDAAMQRKQVSRLCICVFSLDLSQFESCFKLYNFEQTYISSGILPASCL